MKRFFALTGVAVRLLLRDGAALPALLAPLLYGLALRFALPAITDRALAAALEAYRQPMDALLLLLAAYAPVALAGRVLRRERACGMARALRLTPLPRGGYALARVALPAALAFGYALACARGFALLERPLWHDAALAALATAAALAWLPLLARSAGAGWLGALLLLTVALPYALPVTWHPFLGVLPAYWLVRALRLPDIALFAAGAGVSLLWAGLLLALRGRGPAALR